MEQPKVKVQLFDSEFELGTFERFSCGERVATQVRTKTL